MSSREKFIVFFQNIADIDEAAMLAYWELSNLIDDTDLKDMFKFIADSGEKHLRLAKEAVALLKEDG